MERVNATHTEPPRESPINVWFNESIAPQPAMVRGLWAPIVAHAINNAVVLFVFTD